MSENSSEAGHIPGETLELKTEILEFIGEEWLNAPNSWFSGRAPVTLLGTGEEQRLRELFHSILAGDFT